MGLVKLAQECPDLCLIPRGAFITSGGFGGVEYSLG